MNGQSRTETFFIYAAFIFMIPAMIIALPGLLLIYYGEKYLYTPYYSGPPEEDNKCANCGKDPYEKEN